VAVNDTNDIGPGEPDIATEDRTTADERRRQQAAAWRDA
jgi:hypothetical protein